MSEAIAGTRGMTRHFINDTPWRGKLKPRGKPNHYVHRPRLHDLLDDAVRAPVTLVVAPAGAGKTSLVSAWARESAAGTCWLTLDESDRDPSRLWSGVIEALRTVTPECGKQALALLRRRGSVLTAVNDLLDDLDTSVTSRTVLVLDDAHLVDDNEVVASSLARFLDEIPPLLHIVLVSRRVPTLRLDRLRAQGAVGEVHFAELRFSPAEATEMLAHLAPSMPETEVAATVATTEGWAAGIQLAALAARSSLAMAGTGHSSVGGDLLIHDYLWHEAFAHEDTDLVRMLTEVAVVERLDGRLAQTLTGRSDAADLLRQAETRGLFVTRLEAGGWFELHALVRTALLDELARTDPGRVAEQHRRAAAWFEAIDEVPEALEQWLRAAEWRSALRLVAATQSELYDSGCEETIKRTIAAIPLEAATADLEAMVEFAWCHLLTNRRRFVELVDQVTWWCERERCEGVRRGQVNMLRATAAAVNGAWTASGQLARQALEDFGDSWWRDSLGWSVWNAIAREVALTESWDDPSDPVRESELAVSRLPPRRVALEGTRAVGHALAGRQVEALRVVAGVRETTAAENMTILHAELAIAEALAHREIGDRAAAQIELEVLADTPAETMFYCRVLAIAELAEAHLDAGDLVEAQRSLAQCDTLIEAESFGASGRLWLGRVGTKVALAAGDLDSARRWAAQIDDGFWGPVCVARIHLAMGDRNGASEALMDAAARCPRHLVVLALLQAQSTEDRDEIPKLVEAAVERATATGLLQTVVSEGAPLMDAIERAAWRAPQPWMERLRRAAVGGPVHPPASYEPLTERERDVLRFLPSRLTLGEIARELYISVNTLKFHLKVIYRKLGVNSRAEAAEAARRLSSSSHHGR